MSNGFLRHPLLASLGVEHGFGTKAATEVADVRRPRQVHGCAVARPDSLGELRPAEADAVFSDRPGMRVGVVTADCVPILAARASGGVVAIHAGWRGLAAGVVSEGIRALAEDEAQRPSIRAVIGPAIGACCYEVDRPVLDAMRLRFGEDLDKALSPSRPGHARIDLSWLVLCELRSEGLAREHLGRLDDACTYCDSRRFHSFRRSGPRAGRLLHFIEATTCAEA
ncbi:MAG: polyphenol oxidase family protein [Myxococcota bacterium]|nr:polyphenol oxidase family protein [Myxococcota bacterium]